MYINDTIYLNELKNRIRIYLPLYAQIRYIRVSCDSESYILKEKEKTKEIEQPKKTAVTHKPAPSNQTKGFYAETNPDVNQLV